MIARLLARIAPLTWSATASRGAEGGDDAGAGRGRVSRAAGLLPLLAVTVLLLGAGSARADVVHPFLFSFDGSGTPAGEFYPVGVAVDNSSGSEAGKVYVTNGSGSQIVVDRLSSSGSYECQITGHGSATGTTVSVSECDSGTAGTPTGKFASSSGEDAVDSSTGDLYVPDTRGHVVDVFGPGGGYISQIAVPSNGQPGAVALDAAGDVFILANSTPKTIYEYDAATGTVGTFATGTPSGGFSNLQGVAVDDDPLSPSYGDVYVADANSRVVDVFDSSGTYERQLTGTPSGSFLDDLGLAVDPTSGDLYVADASADAVDEFSASGAFISQIPLPSNGNAHSAAINAATGDLYVGDTSNRGVVDVFAPGMVVPDVTTDQATSVAKDGATLNGTVGPDSIALSDCHFEYVDDADYAPSASDPYVMGKTAACVPSAGSIPADSNSHQVTADITGLTPDTVYHFRLVAANANGTNTGQDATFTTLSPPVIDGTSTANLGADAVGLDARIDPEGFDTTYHLEWGTSAAYGHDVPVPDAGIGSGDTDVAVTQHVDGLSPDTEYHWRVVATNSIGTTEGQDHTFVYQAVPPSGSGCANASLRYSSGAALPDCRAYEQVSPADKNGYDINNAQAGGIPNSGDVVAGSGNAVAFASFGAFAGPLAGGLTNEYLAMRGSTGWATQSVDPPETNTGDFNVNSDGAMGGASYFAFSPDLSRGVVGAGPPGADGATPGTDNLYVRNPDGSLALVTPNQSASSSIVATFEGASPDLSHILVESLFPLTSQASACQVGNAYACLFDWSGGQVTLVSEAPVAPATSCSGQLCVPSTFDFQGPFGSNPVSADGSRVFVDGIPVTGAGGAAHGPVYLRDVPSGTTTDISVSQCTTGNCSPAGTTAGALFAGSSTDGSVAFFTSEVKLTNDANTPPASGGGGGGLYEYEVSSARLTDISADSRPSDPTGADVQGLPLVSGDGSYVYFVADGVLAPGATRGGCSENGNVSPQATCNLYVYHAGKLRFIAQVADGDKSQEWDGHTPGSRSRMWQLSPDGTHLLFTTSAQPASGYDNAGYEEEYLYDADSGSVTCVSCNPSGEPADGDAQLALPTLTYQPANDLSASGDQVFFQSADRLLPQATNGLKNVYEWEAGGAGSCTGSWDQGGCLYLISTGQSGTADDVLLGASSSGDDVFFLTHQQLVGSDTDQLQDVYDARVDGGFASQNQPERAPCEGEAGCRSAAGGPPAPAASGTSTFAGPGNPKPNKKTHRKKHQKKHHERHHHMKREHKKPRKQHRHRGSRNKPHGQGGDR